MKQEQFLQVIDRDEAERRFRQVLDLRPLPGVEVPLVEALGRVLAADVLAPVDVPNFDRSNVDGFAVQAEDTFGAQETSPRPLALLGAPLTPGELPQVEVVPGTTLPIATGAMLPRGANAVVMVEHTDTVPEGIAVHRPVSPGANVSYAGSDIGRGETVLRRGEKLTSRETGLLAALGLAQVKVVRRPRVAILSTGDELLAPGEPSQPGRVFDSNATILADAVRELGGDPQLLGIVPDDRKALAEALGCALEHDVVLLSGGTSKGEKDLCYQAVAALGEPGVVAHGVALKPGKPLCLAATRLGTRIIPVVVLPGFPTSAIFTFHEFVAPVVQMLAGGRLAPAAALSARVPMRINSERGRTEFLLVGLVQGERELIAYPMGKGSGSVTAFSKADGFITIPRQQEAIDAGSFVEVRLLDRALAPADLVVIGSHCVGLDFLLGQLQLRGVRSKFLSVGSTAGLAAVHSGECDLAGVHLLHPESGSYNTMYVGAGTALIRGYRRMQGLVFRPGDPRFEGRDAGSALAAALADPQCILANRNRGSGTRILIDRLLGGAQPAGYFAEVKTHPAVAAAVAQGRADWGVVIASVAHPSGLGFTPLQEEHFDFLAPWRRIERPAVKAFVELLWDAGVRAHLQALELVVDEACGEVS